MKKTNFFTKEKIATYNAHRRTLSIPIEVFETAETKEEIEDWLLSQDQNFIKEMRKAKADMDGGRYIPWHQIKRKLNVMK